ncbi:virulence factor [Pseudooceanicola sp. 200-1SW]|uniref:virulence factor n=1 Tax=Pseudooceanicola sp. 200-1SW TaxID=3425949 RepID=UPI003D7F2048
MPQLTILYWRDMPAQVLVGRGRRAAKAPLPERFEQAIDRAAMATGLTGTDAYLAAWRKGEPVEVEGDPQQVADDAIARLDAEYDQDRLKTLIANGGHAPA